MALSNHKHFLAICKAQVRYLFYDKLNCQGPRNKFRLYMGRSDRSGRWPIQVVTKIGRRRASSKVEERPGMGVKKEAQHYRLRTKECMHRRQKWTETSWLEKLGSKQRK